MLFACVMGISSLQIVIEVLLNIALFFFLFNLISSGVQETRDRLYNSIVSTESRGLNTVDVERLMAGFTGEPHEVEAGVIVILIMLLTILLKAGLYVYCQKVADEE